MAVFRRVPQCIPRYTATVLNFADVIVKLPALSAIWLICQHLMVCKFKPPQSSVLSFIFNEILIYIVYCNRNLYFKLKLSSGGWRLEIIRDIQVCRTISQQFPALNALVTLSCLLSILLHTCVHPYKHGYTFKKYQHVLLNIHVFTTSNVAGIIISPHPLPTTLRVTICKWNSMVYNWSTPFQAVLSSAISIFCRFIIFYKRL